MKKLLFLPLAVILFIVLVACGGIDEELVGRWVFEADPSWVTTFNEDGTGTHAISWGYGTTFGWSTSDDNIRWNYPDFPEMLSPYRITGDALYITLDDGTTFRYIRG